MIPIIRVMVLALMVVDAYGWHVHPHLQVADGRIRIDGGGQLDLVGWSSD